MEKFVAANDHFVLQIVLPLKEFPLNIAFLLLPLLNHIRTTG